MKSFLFILLVLILSNQLHSQGLIIGEEYQSFKFDFRYEEKSAPESLPNDIIHKMAQITAPTRDYFFGFTLYEHSQIIKKKQNKYRIVLKADSINHYNKLSYMGYKLNGSVFPNELKFTIQIENANTKREFLITTKKAFDLSNSLLFDTIFTDSSGQGFFVLKNLQISCRFTSEQNAKLDSALATINQIKELEPELLIIKAKLLKLQNIKAGMVQIYNIDLKEIEADLIKINPNKFISRELILELRKEGSLAHYDSLLVLAHKTRKRFDHMINMPEYEYFSEGYHALQKGNREIAKSYFLKSISQKMDYPPPYYYLAEMAYKNQQWDSCSRTISHILNELKPDFTIRKNTLLLGSQLYNTLSEEAQNLIIKSQINEAIKILYIATDLCKNTKELVCNGKADMLLHKAKSDLFYSWVSITNKSILNNKVELSLNYLGWTQEYYNANSQFISRNSELDSLNIKLIHLLSLNASAKNNLGLYQKAIDYINLADSLCAIINYHECETELQAVKVKSYSGLYNNLMRKSKAETDVVRAKTPTIKEAEALKEKYPDLIISKTDSLNLGDLHTEYTNLINKGVEYLKTEDYNKSYRIFNEAIELEGMTPLERNDSLPIYLKAACKPLILSDLNSGNLKAYGMHYQAVNSILKIAREDALKTGLADDPDIIRALEKLEELVFHNKCAEASNLYTKNLQTASENIRFMDYLSASRNWKIAIDLARKNPQCNMDINIPIAQKQRYQLAIGYQELIAEAKLLAEAGKDSLSFSKISLAYDNYSSDTLAYFNLQKTTPYQFSKTSKSTEFQYFNLKWVLDNNKDHLLEESTKRLLPNYNDKAKYAAILKKAAQRQTAIDKKNMESFSPRKRAQKLFVGNKDLIKEYLRALRKT